MAASFVFRATQQARQALTSAAPAVAAATASDAPADPISVICASPADRARLGALLAPKSGPLGLSYLLRVTPWHNLQPTLFADLFGRLIIPTIHPSRAGRRDA